MKKCLVCGVEFEPKNPKGKYCSDKCKMKDARMKKKTKELEPYAIVPVTDLPKDQKTEITYNTPKIEKPNDEPPKVGRTLSKYDQERRMKKLGF